MPARERKRWSQRVTETSDALTLDEGVFAREDPRSIARSLKRSAERSKRRKSDPYRSALSMLTFFINRAGRGLSAVRKRRLELAKRELRRLHGKESSAKQRAGPAKKRSTKKKTSKKRGKQAR